MRGHLSNARFVVLAALALVAGALVLSGRSGSESVAAQPGAINLRFEAVPQVAQVGQEVAFNYSATPPAVAPPFPSVSILINFGDGQSFGPIQGTAGNELQGSVTHAYAAPGTYTAVLQATSSNGQTNSTTVTVQVTGGNPLCAPPQVTVSVAPDPTTVGQPVTVVYAARAGAGCTQQTAPLPSLLINFGDGSSPLPLDGVEGSIRRAYTQPGTYVITVSARSGDQIGQARANVRVGSGQTCGPPIARLTASPQQAVAGQTVSFNYASESGAGCTQETAPLPTITINPGDGTPTREVPIVQGTFTHIYATPGTYTATLTVTSGAQSTRATVTVTVAPAATCGPPIVRLSASPQSGQVGQSITFSYQITEGAGCVQQLIAPINQISFGDSTTPQTLTTLSGTVQHVYNAAGNFTATVTSQLGALTGQASTTVTIGGAPTPTPAPTATPAPSQQGITVAAAAGWNLIGGPAGTVITSSSGPLYTFGTTDTAYETVNAGTALTAGRGYWAFFPVAGNYTVPFTGAQTFTVQAPAGRYFMVGNPGNSPATVTGADIVYTYNAAGSNYVATTTIPVGGGAWVLSNAGGTITVTSPAR